MNPDGPGPFDLEPSCEKNALQFIAEVNSQYGIGFELVSRAQLLRESMADTDAARQLGEEVKELDEILSKNDKGVT